MRAFSRHLIDWHKHHGRHNLPWQQTRDPYRIWLSEIMLQQTQVATVIPYYSRFLERFPDIASLAAADLDEVLQLWSGLGYYSRARNLHRAAQMIVAQHHGTFPRDFDQILMLPGIGRSTAAAISAFAFGERHAILDGNVKRVFARHFGIEGYPGEKKVENAMWEKAEQLLPQSGIEAYIQALMDLGATVCGRSRPACAACPLQNNCAAHAQGRTAELPEAKQRKALPRKETVMLILLSKGEVMLEKRPPTGIWGGLWSFPEIAVGEDPVAICAERYGMAVKPEAPWPHLNHTFTHFKLNIVPQPLQLLQELPRVNEGKRMWLNKEEALGAAIPTPIRKLLRQIGLREPA